MIEVPFYYDKDTYAIGDGPDGFMIHSPKNRLTLICRFCSDIGNEVSLVRAKIRGVEGPQCPNCKRMLVFKQRRAK